MYRFALYGRSNAGKTCLLAAMSMGAEGLPGGFTVERIPVTDDDSGPTQSPELSALRAGREWIDQAISRLRDGSIPEGNPPAFDGTGMITDFQIGSPDRGTLILRTVDYSGELISPDDEDAPDSGASLLRTFLAQYDGFLILAETPKANSDNAQLLSDELRRLREAFVSLRRNGSHPQTPVAVVFTKWDRYSDVTFDDPAQELDKLREFLGAHHAHASLIQTISNALEDVADSDNEEEANQYQNSEWDTVNSGEDVPNNGSDDTSGDDGRQGELQTSDGHSNGLQHGNCAVFPASAFGRVSPDTKLERPADAQPQPFGLLEPFLWLAARRDELDTRHLTRDFENVPDWLYCVRPKRLNMLLRRAESLADRIPATSGPGRTLRRMQSQARRLRWVNSIGYTVVCVLTMSIAWCTWCVWEFESRIAATRHPQRSEEYLRNDREWFTTWLQKPFPLTGLTSSERAQTLIDEIDTKLEDLYWPPVSNADSESRKLLAAEAYLDQMPGGQHIDEAQEIIASIKTKQEQDGNENWLQERELEVKLAESVLTALEAAQEALEPGLPHPQAASEDHADRFRHLRNQVANDLTRIRGNRDWTSFAQGIDDLIQATNFDKARMELLLWPNRNDDWREYCKSFPGLVMKSVDLEVGRFREGENFAGAFREIDKADQMFAMIESVLKNNNEPALADVMLQAQADTASRRQKMKLDQDKYLYGKVTQFCSEPACRDYLKVGGVMRSEVDKYAKWLAAIHGPLDVTVSVKIFWSKEYSSGYLFDGNGDDHKLTLVVNDKKMLSKSGLADKPDTWSGEIGRFILKGQRLAKPLKGRAELIEDDPGDFDDDVGQGVFNFPLEALIDNKTKEPVTKELVINPADGTKYNNKLKFQIVSGVPAKPKLPLWNNPSSSR